MIAIASYRFSRHWATLLKQSSKLLHHTGVVVVDDVSVSSASLHAAHSNSSEGLCESTAAFEGLHFLIPGRDLLQYFGH
jgi:hypothetical protein